MQEVDVVLLMWTHVNERLHLLNNLLIIKVKKNLIVYSSLFISVFLVSENAEKCREAVFKTVSIFLTVLPCATLK